MFLYNMPLKSYWIFFTNSIENGGVSPPSFLDLSIYIMEIDCVINYEDEISFDAAAALYS